MTEITARKLDGRELANAYELDEAPKSWMDDFYIAEAPNAKLLYVGYIEQELDDPNPLDDDGYGTVKLYGRRGSGPTVWDLLDTGYAEVREEAAKDEGEEPFYYVFYANGDPAWDQWGYQVQVDAGWEPDPYARSLSVFEHSMMSVKLSGGHAGYPDANWDCSDPGGIWRPDPALIKEFESWKKQFDAQGYVEYGYPTKQRFEVWEWFVDHIARGCVEAYDRWQRGDTARGQFDLYIWDEGSGRWMLDDTMVGDTQYGYYDELDDDMLAEAKSLAVAAEEDAAEEAKKQQEGELNGWSI